MLFVEHGLIDFNSIFHRRKKKRVSFDTISKVVLIPTKDEYNKFRDSLWYNEHDYKKFAVDFRNASLYNLMINQL